MSYQLYCHEICPLVKGVGKCIGKDRYTENFIRRKTFETVNNITPYTSVRIPENLIDGIDVPTNSVACQNMINRYGYALRRNLGISAGDVIKCPFVTKIYAIGGSEIQTVFSANII
jgi:hypothetical protein